MRPVVRPVTAIAYAALAPEHNETWYSDGKSGFSSVRRTNGVWPREK